MNENQHPATLISPHHDPRPWQDCTREDIREGDLVERLGNDRRLVGEAHHQDQDDDWCTKGGWLLTLGDLWPLRRIPAHTTEKETPMPETTTPAEPLARTLLAVPEGHGAPHHDAGRIKAGDYVVQMDEDGTLSGGRIHRQEGDGDWLTENGGLITWAARRSDRPDALTVWPAPTPPAVEVEMPREYPAHITDVEAPCGVKCAYMALDRRGYWRGVGEDGTPVSRESHRITAFTLPDGTRVRRDGERENGEPRFVKTQEV